MNSDPAAPSVSRRQVLRGVGVVALGSLCVPTSARADAEEGVSFADGPRPLVAYPEKRPLYRVTTRPPHLETPFHIFDEGPITPNDAFFVRYHLANIPTSIDPETYRIVVKGAVRTPLKLSLSDLKQLADPVEVVAVNQCSGNSRGFSSPRVFGAQLANGAMGNARWVGVPVRAVLVAAGIARGARQVVFDGLDRPALPVTPDFRKSLDVAHALSGEPLLAWSMNGAEIPVLNGYPLRLVVPGYFGTYWVKHVSEIEVLEQEFTGHDAYFMTTAYRLPDTGCLCVAPGTAVAKTRPIGLLPVRSFITNLTSGATVPSGHPFELKGIAFDGGAGIAVVEVSTDGGRRWRSARLGTDLGRFSFREWHLAVQINEPGSATLMVRAASKRGEQQPITAEWNPGGYRRHAVESTNVFVG